MTGAVATDILRNLGRVQSLFPRDFNAVAECLRAGIAAVELASSGAFYKTPAMYDPEDMVVRIDPHLTDHDRAQLAREINARHRGLGVTASDVTVFTLYHELGHHVRRKQLLSMDRRNGVLGGLSFWEAQGIAEEERLAEEHAKKEYTAWKRRRRC